MGGDTTKSRMWLIRIEESDIRRHPDELVWGVAEEALNGLLDGEADEIPLVISAGTIR